jgi:hypothetical protein
LAQERVDVFEVTFTGLRERLQSLDRLEREQLPEAAALALTTTAYDVRDALVNEMRTVFDRPTRYTLNSLFVERASIERMKARVWLKDREQDSGGRPASEWLAPQIYGGGRNQKAVEKRLSDKGALPDGKYIVPGKGLKLDAYGNISRGTMNKILSGLGAQFDRYANSTTSRRSVGNFKRYFVMKKGNRPIGIAERTGKGKSGMRMVIAFASRPQYSKRFDFFEVAKRVAEDRLPIRFELALARSLGTRNR